MQPASHERAQPLGINVRVARDCCDALVAEESISDGFSVLHPPSELGETVAMHLWMAVVRVGEPLVMRSLDCGRQD